MLGRRPDSAGLRRGAHLRPWLLALGAGGLFGLAAPMGKLLLSGMHPSTMAGWLYLGAALAVTPWAHRQRPSWRAFRRQAAPVALMVLTGGVLAPLLMLTALRQAEAAPVAVWLNAEVVLTAMLGTLFFKESLGRRGRWAVTLMVASGLALAWPWRGPNAMTAGCLLAACLCWALDNNITATLDSLTPSQTTWLKGLMAGSFNLLCGWVLAPGAPSLEQLTPVVALGALSYGTSIVLYVRASQQLGATRAQLTFAIHPLIGLAASVWVLGEQVHAQELLGLLLAMSAVVVLQSSEHAHEHDHVPVTHTHWHRHDDGHHNHSHSGDGQHQGHTHEHVHGSLRHAHAHVADLHHRHDHPGAGID